VPFILYNSSGRRKTRFCLKKASEASMGGQGYFYLAIYPLGVILSIRIGGSYLRPFPKTLRRNPLSGRRKP
jgi:hypothetical protein